MTVKDEIAKLRAENILLLKAENAALRRAIQLKVDSAVAAGKVFVQTAKASAPVHQLENEKAGATSRPWVIKRPEAPKDLNHATTKTKQSKGLLKHVVRQRTIHERIALQRAEKLKSHLTEAKLNINGGLNQTREEQVSVRAWQGGLPGSGKRR